MKKIYEVQRIKQVVTESEKERYTIVSPEDVVEHAYELIGEDDREIFLVMVLNTKNEVVAVHRCHIGTLSSCAISTKDIFKTVFLNNGNSLICLHQHPSGNPIESKEDRLVAKKIKEASLSLDTQLLDFMILGEKNPITSSIKNTSFKEKGLL